MWTDTTRAQYARADLALPSDLTDAEWAVKDDAKRRVDLLFISHFDRDHVSGIVQLMSMVEVDTVVIPYLDDLQRAVNLVLDLADREEVNRPGFTGG